MSTSDENEMAEATASLLRAESGFSKSFGEDCDEQTDIELVQERLLSFYSKQLQHPPQKSRSTLKQTAPLLIHKPHAYPCQDTHSRLPCIPQKWPQRPVSKLQCACLFVFTNINTMCVGSHSDKTPPLHFCVSIFFRSC